MLPDELRPRAEQVTSALRRLERALRAFTQALAHGDEPLEVDGMTERRAARRRVVEAFATIDYGIDDAPMSTPVCLGVVGASRELLALAAAVNAAKQELRAACAGLTRKVRVPSGPGGTGPTEVIAASRAILRSIGRADLNLLAAYRQVPVLGARPALIAYTRAYTRRVQRLSRAALLDRLEHSDKVGAAEDRARVRACRDRAFAWVEAPYENIRANVRYESTDRRGRGRVQVAAELPLLFALGRSTAWPEIRFPGPAGEPGPAHARVGVLEPEPYLTTVPVHRYRA